VSIRWEDAEWRQYAACLGKDPAVWFPTPDTTEEEVEGFRKRGVLVEGRVEERNAVTAKRICIGYATYRDFTDIETGEVETVAVERHDGCPVAEQCATWAVVSRQQAGIFGGFGADGKLKWLRALLWGNDDSAPEVESLEDLLADPIEGSETLDLSDLISAIRTEQAQLKIEYGLEEESATQREWTPMRACGRCGDPIPAGRHPPDRNTPGATCGVAVTYAKGCRCFRCRVSNARRER